MESNQATSGKIIDPFEAEQERAKWMNKAQYVLVLVIRGVVFMITIFLKVMLEVLKNVLRTFKILQK